MKTKNCGDTYRALCRKDVGTTTHRTFPAVMTSNTVTTIYNTASVGIESDAPTTSRGTTANIGSTDHATPTSPFNSTTVLRNNCFVRRNKIKHLSLEELNYAVLELKTLLAVNKTKLSSYRCKHISVYDPRLSSVAMGGVAIAILTAIIGMILIPDMVDLARFFYK
ncbi:uncharacterized protein LOC117328538 [Pecten maximus]|uniref:uncharacterized protein LOC117328538 n=1 Tax=Pecten maximus TaxID=6579 RepID=UPI0014587BF7|nr:uncharacterized protein LOC117328538 [Pecten maximus]